MQLLPSAIGDEWVVVMEPKDPARLRALSWDYHSKPSLHSGRLEGAKKAQGAGEGKGSVGGKPEGWNEERQGIWSLLSDERSRFIGLRSPLSCEVGIQSSFLLHLWVAQAFEHLEAPRGVC